MDMINEVEAGPEGIKYPGRTATFLRNTHYLSRFDGDQSFINLEEQESNMSKERMIQEELRKMARTMGTTHSGLLAESSTPKVDLSVAGDENTVTEAIDDVERIQGSTELQERAKRFNTQRQAKLQLGQLSDATESSLQQFQTPRDDDTPNLYTSEPKALEILNKVKRRFRQKAPEVAMSIGSGALSVASAVGSGALNVAGAVLEAGQREFDNTVQDYMQLGSFIKEKVKEKLKDQSMNHVKHFLLSPTKPTFMDFMNALYEAKQAYPADSLLEGPMTQQFKLGYNTWDPTGSTKALTSSSSSSSSSSSTQPAPSGPPTSFSPQSHDTDFKSFDSIKEWKEKGGGKGSMVDQLYKRPEWGKFLGVVNSKGFFQDDAGPELRKQLRRMSRDDIAKIILQLDGKPVQ
jgi:arsenate reductase-like glutaredoxin family protein